MRKRVEVNRYKNIGEGGENQAWIFSYADLMSLLLGFFIILYSFSQMSDKQLQSITRDIAQSFKGEEGNKVETTSEVGMLNEQRQLKALEVLLSLMEIAPTDAGAIAKIEHAKQNGEAKKELKEKLKVMQEKHLLYTQNTKTPKDWQLDVVLPSNILYRKGSSQLTSTAKSQLIKLVPEIIALERQIYVKIIGHSDTSAEDLGEKFQDHWALTANRAAAVADFFIENGVDPLTMEVIGRSYYEPLFPEFTDFGEPIQDNMQKNRRVHIQFHRRAEK